MNRDFRELLSEFSRHGVEHLVIGAHALVRSDVAQGAVVGGVPAEELKIRSRRSPTQEPG